MADALNPPREPVAVQKAPASGLERARAAELIPVTAVQALNLSALFEKAMDLPDGAEKLDKLVDLAMKIEDREARQIFNAKLLEFQERCPKIPKGGLIDFATRDGTGG